LSAAELSLLLDGSTTPDEIEAIYPLSPMQQGILFHTTEAAPDSGVYFLQSRYLLEGELDIDNFRRAWRQVVERHEILRTAFLWRERPIQVVFRSADPDICFEDWSPLSGQEQVRRMEEFM